jgi:hypothetical protein
VEDLLGFDDVPAPAPAAATGENADFGAFQGSSAPTPANASDDFAAFDQIRSAKAQGPDPFAAPTPAQQQQPASFDAFGTNNVGVANNNMMGNNMMMNNNMMNNNMNNNMAVNNNMAAMGNAFNNMSVGAGTPAGGMQQPTMPTSNDDDFGDFADANVASFQAVTKKISSDPLAGLINLDGLSKNPSNKMTMNQPVAVNAAAAQYQQAIQNGGQAQGTKSRSDFCFVVQNGLNKKPMSNEFKSCKQFVQRPICCRCRW